MSKAPDVKAKNKKTMLSLAMMTTGMLCLAYASVPLYEIFCQVTGFGGTTQHSGAAPSETNERLMRVRFDANVAHGMPWSFKTLQTEVTVKLGEEKLIFYKAKNLSNEPITGVATFNVTPEKSGPFFDKIACFCFENQTLAPGEEIEMPVSFFVDPELVKDRSLDGVKTITLSYTFFRAKEQPLAQAPAAATEKAATPKL
ncbi:cytochrome c oxidase assembly protein [Lacibacterium aquatile]|uniref:Cytochrome c oxidase assembly protein CtaG n=1 Tax=Lacibacterium aquatile TaxID=1168082 RepID=A0ABW5DSM5_9PROT